MIQNFKSNALAFAEMLTGNVVAAAMLALVIGSRITFKCVTSEASTWSLVAAVLLLFHLAWRHLSAPTKDVVVIGRGLAPLRQNITVRFSDQEIRTLCFDLDVDYEDLPGEGKESKVRELIAYMRRRDRIPELVNYCCEQRPSVDWEAMVKLSARAGPFEASLSGRTAGAVTRLFDVLHPRAEMMPDLLLQALTAASCVIAVIMPLYQPPLFPPVEPTPFIESFSVQYPEQPASLKPGDAIKLIAGEPVEVRAALRGSASTLCTWFREKGILQPAEGCSIFYSAPFGEATDILTVRVQSLCKTRETYGGLSVTVQTR